MSVAGEPQILLIEDDTDIRQSLSELLEDAGFRVAAAEDGLQALQYLRKNPPPTLILLDLLMPFMDGFEFRRETLKEPKLAAIPVIITTALSAEFRAENTLRAAAYFTKPLDIHSLLRTVRKFCGPPVT